MSSKDAAKAIGSQIALSSSKIALSAFESHIEEKLNEKTEKQESTESKKKADVNKPKSF
ncbi:MAG: hypothetical protein KME23_27025 [Goleter apudmare HA4340-LM2]|jgi:hypothetical protein|nr:hypothetical protein [Goleter apudmare HA4340-LM2]